MESNIFLKCSANVNNNQRGKKENKEGKKEVNSVEDSSDSDTPDGTCCRKNVTFKADVHHSNDWDPLGFSGGVRKQKMKKILNNFNTCCK